MIDGGWGAFRPAWSDINRIRADYPHSRQRSRGGQRPSEDIKAEPGAGLPATSGGEPYSAATIDGWRRCETSRRVEGENKPVAIEATSRRAPDGVGEANQRERLAKFQHARSDIDGLDCGDEGDEGVHHHNNEPFIVELMNALNWAFVRGPDQQPPDQGRWRSSQNSRFPPGMRVFMRVLMNLIRHRGRHGLPHNPPISRKTAGAAPC